MKKILFILFLTPVFGALAQGFPYGINYQAVVRDANGNAKTNQQVPLQFTILQSGLNGTIVWQERQILNTNGMGQCNAVIGNGNPVSPFNSSSFSQINWGLDSTFLKVEINANVSFTGVFTPLGAVTKFQAVPYALNAKTKSPTMQVFTSGSGTYITPLGVKFIKVRMVGGGGGGSNGTNVWNSGGGGGAGAYIEKTIIAPSAIYSYTVGIGGAVGNNGNSSIFGDAVANGGNAGLGSGGAGGGNSSNGGTFIFGTGGLGFGVNGSGGTGGSSGSNAVSGGCGGSGPFGGQGAGTISGGGSNASSNSGSGGGGGAGSGAGSGGSGVIIVEEYYQ